ncbi:MAG: hypothetical protein N2235_02880 [Fischerella sp.]|nr:hypothetical protein [Fischerella sp.]
MFDHVAEEKFRTQIRNSMLRFVFEEFDKLAKQENWSFDHTSIEVDGDIKII